ncbi:MAG: hypothetical protein ACP6KW_05290 [Candidatus Thorarchaeota archaeon]
MTSSIQAPTTSSMESLFTPSQLPHSGVRVAIYDEDNLTVPAVSAAENLTNHLDEITALLEGAGHTVTPLTTSDILDHKLITAKYDVFILANNLPRESITKLVREFWMGGGGLLTLGGAMSWLWYENILWPDLGYDPRGIAWEYVPTDALNVSARHPTMMDYHINDTLSLPTANWATCSWSLLSGSVVSGYMTRLLHNLTSSDFVSAFVMDLNRKEGGRLVHLPGDGENIPSWLGSIIVDSVEWLLPRPRGRIAFDLTHQARLGIDPWDSEYVTAYTTVANFGQFRDLAVNHTFTFDKLYPSSTGNLTADRLADYDVLIIPWPDVNFSNADCLAVEEWVNDGGSILVLGDRTGLGSGAAYINTMLRNFDMSLGTTDITSNVHCTPGTHVTLGSSSSLFMGFHNYLSIIGSAVPLWSDGSNTVVAAQQFGSGRAILSADMNVFDNSYLAEDDNSAFAIDALIWLTSTDADILLYSNSMHGVFSECEIALRDLGLSYMSFRSSYYFSSQINSSTWKLLVVNAPFQNLPNETLNTLYSYVDGGGRLLMSYYDMDDAQTHPLWSKLGIEYVSTFTVPPVIHVWDSTHPVFAEPHNMSGATFTSIDLFVDDGDKVSVTGEATALAGATATEQDDEAYMVLGPSEETLYASFLIDSLTTDEDDSTYSDGSELWQNLITYMTTEGGGGGLSLDPTTLAIVGGAALALVLIGGLAKKRRGGSGATKTKTKRKSSRKK